MFVIKNTNRHADIVVGHGVLLSMIGLCNNWLSGGFREGLQSELV